MDDRAKLVPCPTGCTVVQTSTSGPHQRKGQDYDSYFFDVIDEAGAVVGKHEVRDSMSMYPPFKRNIHLV